MSNKYLSRVLYNLKKNPIFSPVECPYHNDNMCLQITTNHNGKRYHCLYERECHKWCAYDCNASCDVPEYFLDVYDLSKSLNSEYALPLRTHFREQSGFTVGFYQLTNGLYAAKILKEEYLMECFLTFTVILCQICFMYGGNCPQMNRMKFIYTQQHPVLVDVGKENNAAREKCGSRNLLNKKKWERFLNTRTTKEIIHYVKIHHPEFFKSKCQANKVCILNGTFSDATHQLICRNKKTNLKSILEQYNDQIPKLTPFINKLLEPIQ